MVVEEFFIHELAERAGISVRTIRYYIEEGLLPQPSYQGKYSYYSPSYLDRLELIRRLKESYLPLREIREIMNTLSDEEVKHKLLEPSATTPRFQGQPMPSQPNARPAEKALQYIDQIMEDQSRYKTKGTTEKNQIRITRQSDLAVPPMSNLQDIYSDESEGMWQRFELATGVELHLRHPIQPEMEYRVRQLLSFSRKIFSTKLQGGTK
ncbi:MAG: MerR family transcriptional regulator [Anaerolineae bacterium]|nr:MerR family transcriptional regulator [Anaerolineae bacterium]